MPLVRPCPNRWCPNLDCQVHAEVWIGQPMPPGWAATRARQLAAFPVCQDCGAAPSAEVHHQIPRYAGGTDDPANLRALCHRCHRKLPTWLPLS